MAKLWINEQHYVDIDKKQPLFSQEIATRKRSINFSSFLGYLPNPDPILKRTGQSIKIYEELRLEPQTRTCIQSRKSGVMSLLNGINRGKAKTEVSEFIEENFNELPLQTIIEQILDAPNYGFQPLEVSYKSLSSGKMAIDKIESKPVEWFMFDDENRLRFRSKWDYMMGELLPDKKFLCPSYESTYNNPYGNPLLSSCFWPVTFKKGGLQFWVVFVEKYGMPHVIGKVPPGTKQEDRGRVMEMLDAMVQDAVAVINNDESIEFISDAGKSASTNAFSQLISYCNDDIAKVILGQTLTTQVGNVGSYAAGKVHATIRQDIVDTDVRLVKQTFNQLIRWITEINWGKVNDYPTFDLWAEEDVDIARSQRDKTLTESGVKFTKKYWQNAYGLEPEDFELAPEPPPVTSTMPMQFAEGKEDISGNSGEELIKLEDALIQESELHFIGEGLVKDIVGYIKNCSSFSEAQKGLYKQFKNINKTTLQLAIEKSLAISKIAGFLSDTTK